MYRTVFAVSLAALASFYTPCLAQQVARGIVFEDENGNGVFDSGEPGLPNVAISADFDLVLTGDDGRFEIPVDDDSIVYAVKPTGFASPVNDDQIPQFHYIHKPDGSPDLFYDGVAPTGPLPDQIEFPFVAQDESGSFDVVLIADPQPENGQEVDYVRMDIGSELPLLGADFVMSLGDIMFDQLHLFDAYNRIISVAEIPHYGVIGNHDMNYDSPNDEHSDETFERIYGPSTHAFNYGKAHFAVLDNIRWNGEKNRTGNYTSIVSEAQADWLKKDLEHVPEDYLVVIATHAPIWVATSDRLMENADLLFDALKDRKRVLAVNGHTHYNNHHFFTEEEGWEGDGVFHQNNIVTVCGSWWSGPKDYRGVPVATQRDGTPNGYAVLTVGEDDYSIRYKAAGFDRDYQMEIYPPELNRRDGNALLVNIFDGMPEAKVEYRIDKGEFLPMTFIPQFDPIAQDFYTGPGESGKTWVDPANSFHIWEAWLGEDARRGQHLYEIRYEDNFGRKFKGVKLH